MHLRVYRLPPGGISKPSRYINCMQNLKLVAESEIFCMCIARVVH